jgi:hypothetical protein
MNFVNCFFLVCLPVCDIFKRKTGKKKAKKGAGLKPKGIGISPEGWRGRGTRTAIMPKSFGLGEVSRPNLSCAFSRFR